MGSSILDAADSGRRGAVNGVWGPRAGSGRAQRRGRRRARWSVAGFTLLEVLLAAALGAIVLGAAVSLLRVQGAAFRRAQAELAAAGSAWWALDVAARDVQLAGADPSRAGVAPIASAAGDQVVLAADLDGDASVDVASAEQVSLYRTAASGGRFIRRLGNQAMNIAERVPEDGLGLRYFDALGAELGAGGGALAAASLPQVARIALQVAVREPFAAEQIEVRLRGAGALRARLGARP
jgi:prepilin-type N-terminal cleavage/methylation domain-containing protein